MKYINLEDTFGLPHGVGDSMHIYNILNYIELAGGVEFATDMFDAHYDDTLYHTVSDRLVHVYLRQQYNTTTLSTDTII